MRIFLYIQLVWIVFISTAPLSTVIGQTQWEKYGGNPVLVPDAQSGIIAFSDPTLLFDGATYHLWISGGGFVPGGTVASVRTYYYTSSDGFSWQGNPANPVFREGVPGAWDSGHIETPSVIANAGDLWLYYAATPDSMANEGSQLKFGLAIYQDGESWTRSSANPILERGTPGSWEGRWIESPCIFKTDSLFYMWYSGVDIWWRIHVGLATSRYGINWQKYPGNPVFSPRHESEWDSMGVYAPQVRWSGDRFVMLYTGLVLSDTGYDFNSINTGMAVSKDGIHWSRVSDQPVLSGTPDAWDVSGPFTLDWVEAKNQLLMAYVSDGKVGMAEASPVDAINIYPDVNRRSIEYTLFQNYPNPFNSSTTIQYHLSKTAMVKIRICNLLGELVQTLVAEVRQAGDYKISWNGKNIQGIDVDTGLYLVRMSVGDFSESKKILLLK